MNNLISLIHSYPFLSIIMSFFLGLFFMPTVIDIAKKRNFVVKPNKRTSHIGYIPNIGGINIFVSFFITVFLFSYTAITSSQFLVIGVFVILVVGFVDDLLEIKPTTKLIGEFISAFFLIVMADIRLTSINLFGVIELNSFESYLFSFFVFLVVINSLNLIDGVDGLASGLGIIYCLFFGVYFTLTTRLDLAILAFSMVGSLTVFFIYNVFGKKRKIFMGDSGSLLLGYLLVLFVFEFCEMNNLSVKGNFRFSAAPAVAICVLAVPLFDTLRVVVTRLKKGVSPFRPDKNHIHHLLLKIGLTHREVTFVLMVVSLFFIGLGILGRNWNILLLALTALVMASILIMVLWNLVNRKILPKK